MANIYAFLICVFIALFSLTSCDKLHNTVIITNDAKTDQPIYFNCHPKKTLCPYHVRHGGKAVFKDINSLTIVVQGKLYVIAFTAQGRFTFKLKDILDQKHPIHLKGQCKTIKIYETHEVIDCNSGKKVSNEK